MQFRSFKFRLTLGYAFMMTVFLAGFAILMYTELARALYRDVERSMYAEAQSIERGIIVSFQERPDGKFESPPATEKGALAFPAEFQQEVSRAIRDWERKQRRITRSLFLVRIVGLDRSLIGSNLGGWERDILFPDYERDSALMEKGDSYQTIHFQKNPIRLYYHIVPFQGRPFFTIQIAKPLYEIEKTLTRLGLIIAVIIPLGVALACVAGWFLAKRFLRPVDEMIQQARKITAAYLKGRLPRTLTRDELDRLAETLNEMIDLHTKRLAAYQNRVPLAIYLVLCGVSVSAVFLMGFYIGFSKHRAHIMTMMLALLVASVMWLILDLDQPTSGSIRTSQQSLIDLQQDLNPMLPDKAK